MTVDIPGDDMTGDQKSMLLQRLSAARGAAHRAPFAEWSRDHQGHSLIVNHTTAFAVRGHEYFELAQEAKRLGLGLPQCDCPEGSHQ